MDWNNNYHKHKDVFYEETTQTRCNFNENYYHDDDIFQTRKNADDIFGDKIIYNDDLKESPLETFTGNTYTPILFETSNYLYEISNYNNLRFLY